MLTGQHLRLTTPNDVMTARDSIEWWSEKHMGVGRGDASVTSKDGRRITADVLVAYTTPATPPPSGAAPVKTARPQPRRAATRSPPRASSSRRRRSATW